MIEEIINDYIAYFYIMKESAKLERYETAAKYRDKLNSIINQVKISF